LNSLLPHYISKNYPKFLDSKLDHNWQKYCRLKLTQGGQASMLNKYFARIEELKKTFINKSDQYILEELNLYGQSVVQHFDTNNDLN
ncbi:MAG TPA: hypothetical protein VLF63_02940, partial [Patescibacteria group bacterium]|nr:hypothetical protein [Patescibacteria group bacterium]